MKILVAIRYNLLITSFSVLLLSITLPCVAQELSIPPLKGPAIYLNGGGTSLLGVSLNADFRIFNTAKRTAFLMGGISSYQFSRQAKYQLLSVGLNFVKGKGNHHSELGAAFTYNEGAETIGPDNGSKSTFLTGIAGYRYQRPTGGLFFRIYYAPFIKLKEYSEHKSQFIAAGDFVALGAGAGLGYSF